LSSNCGNASTSQNTAGDGEEGDEADEAHPSFPSSSDEGDTATEVFLHWYINEQVEEETNADAIVEKLKLVKDSSNGLYMLDKELGARKKD